MFTLLGARQRFCDGLTRRNFLKIGAFGAGLTLADMLRLRVAATRPPLPAAPGWRLTALSSRGCSRQPDFAVPGWAPRGGKILSGKIFASDRCNRLR